MNPYEVLDLPPDADTAAVRRAYRKRAKKVHPDHGGSPDEFALVKRAHDILADPDRRARFDRTGDAEEVGPDTTVSLALQMISAALDEVLGEIEKEGREPHKVSNLVARMLSKVRQKKAEVEQRSTALYRAEALNQLLIGRFTSKGGESRIEALIRGRLGIVKTMLAQAHQQIVALDEATEIVGAHAFRADPEECREQTASLMQMFGGRW